VRVAIGIEDVDDRDLANCQRNVINRPNTANLINTRIDRLTCPSEVKHLAEKCALKTEIRFGLPNLVRFPARETSRPQGVAQAEALINLRIDVKGSAVPQADSREQREVRSLLAVASRSQTVWSFIRRGEAWVILFDECKLAMHVPALGKILVTGRCRHFIGTMGSGGAL
jgi:hypothetical protein